MFPKNCPIETDANKQIKKEQKDGFFLNKKDKERKQKIISQDSKTPRTAAIFYIHQDIINSVYVQPVRLSKIVLSDLFKNLSLFYFFPHCSVKIIRNKKKPSHTLTDSLARKASPQTI